MPKIFRTQSSVKLPRRARAEQHGEHGREHKGIEKCKRCENVHYKKRWYHSIRDVLQGLKGKTPMIKEKGHCPACKMIQSNTFEGEVVIEKVPQSVKSELMHLIKNYGNKATRIDPQDRIIAVKETKESVHLTTTENQLAEKIAKKIREVFNNVALRIVHSKEPYEVTRVQAVFQEI